MAIPLANTDVPADFIRVELVKATRATVVGPDRLAYGVSEFVQPLRRCH
jgi:hypothetical protein